MHNSIRLETRQVPINRKMDKMWCIQTTKYYLAIKRKELLIHINKYDLNALCRVKEAFYKEYILCDSIIWNSRRSRSKQWHKNIRILVTSEGHWGQRISGKEYEWDFWWCYSVSGQKFGLHICIYICQNSANISLKIHTFVCKFHIKRTKEP